MIDTVTFRLNHEPVQLTVDKERPLLWVLRSDLGLTGTKYGCGIGACGSCTVLVNREPLRSCQMQVTDVAGKEVLTIEGLARNGTLHPLQRAFIDHGAIQCGFCTPGMVLSAYGLLLRKPSPTEKEIIEGLEDNLCRCGTHRRVVRAVQSAAKRMRG